MKALLSFTIKSRLRQLFGGKYAWAVNGWRLLWLFFTTIYGLGIAFLMTKGYEEPEKINLSEFIFAMNVMAFMMVLLRNFFPFYQFRSPFIPAIYPIARWKAIFLEIVYDMFSLLFVMALIFFGLAAFGKGYFLQHFAESMLIIGNGYFIERSMKKFLEQQFDGYCAAFGLFIISILAFIGLHFWMPDAYAITRIAYSLALFLFFIGNIFFNIYLESKRSMLKGGSHKVYATTNRPMTISNAIIPYYFKNKKIRLMIIMAIAFKVFFMVASVACYLKKGGFFFQPEALFWVFLSPLVIFTYTHCNLFGYMRSIWLSAVNSGNWQHLLKIYFSTLAIPLTIDAVLSFVALGLIGWLDWQAVAFYFSILLLCLIVGFVGSIYKPIKFENAFSFGKQQNSSPWVSLPLMIGIGGLIWAKSSIFFIPLFLIALAVPIYFLWKAKQDWSLRWQKMYGELFK